MTIVDFISQDTICFLIFILIIHLFVNKMKL